ncbi:MAG: hypothetical protein WAU01_02280, partial [Saprospiraceae bacterium]
MKFRKSTYYTSVSLLIFLILGYWGHTQAGLLKLNIGSTMGEKGTRVCLDVTAENFKDIEAIQFSFSYNASLITLECPLTYVHPLFGKDIFNCDGKENGFINFVWVSGATTIPDNEIIFTLCFNIVGDPGNVSPIFLSNLTGEIEVCSAGPNNSTVCSEKLDVKVGSITIKSNTLQVLHRKCDADGVNNIDNASLTFYGTGGTPPYNYTVTPGGFSGTLPSDGQRLTLSNIPQSTYNITITDSNGLMATSGSIVVTNSFPITYDTPIVKSPTCFNRKNGSIEIPNTNGNTPFRFEWSNLISGGNTFNKISDLESGKYKVTITDFGGCAKVDSFNLSVDTLRVNLTVDKSASCNQPQVRDGAITITTSGGTTYKNGLPYEYSLNGNNWIRFASPTSLNNMP